MKPVVTNIWSKVLYHREMGWDQRLEGLDASFLPASVVVLESTVAPQSLYVGSNGTSLAVNLSGLELNMPPGRIRVFDGLIREVEVLPGTGSIPVRVQLVHPAAYNLHTLPGIPVRTVMVLERAAIARTLQGRLIALDPAHGGSEAGARGPINLLEKDIVLDIAMRLKRFIERDGGRVVLTRESDMDTPMCDRLKLLTEARPDCICIIHTGHGAAGVYGGVRTTYGRTCGSEGLAVCLQTEIVGKLALKDRGVRPMGPVPYRLPCPIVSVETVCIRHPLEEALLRSPDFKNRMSQAMCNGLVAYLSRLGGGGDGREV